MEKKTSAAENMINKIFEDLEQTLRSHASPNYPSQEPVRDEQNDNGLKGTDLFSKFTADIIKEEVLFTR